MNALSIDAIGIHCRECENKIQGTIFFSSDIFIRFDASVQRRSRLYHHSSSKNKINSPPNLFCRKMLSSYEFIELFSRFENLYFLYRNVSGKMSIIQSPFTYSFRRGGFSDLPGTSATGGCTNSVHPHIDIRIKRKIRYTVFPRIQHRRARLPGNAMLLHTRYAK